MSDNAPGDSAPPEDPSSPDPPAAAVSSQPPPPPGRSRIRPYLVLTLVVLAAAGGAFFLLTGDDDELPGARGALDGPFDPEASYDPGDPVAVVTRFQQAYWAGDCETAVSMFERNIWNNHLDRDLPALAACQRRYDEHMVHMHAVTLLGAELVYEEDGFVIVRATEEYTRDMKPYSDEPDLMTFSWENDYILVRSGDNWHLVLEEPLDQLDEYLSETGITVEEYFERIYLDDPPVPTT